MSSPTIGRARPTLVLLLMGLLIVVWVVSTLVFTGSRVDRIFGEGGSPDPLHRWGLLGSFVVAIMLMGSLLAGVARAVRRYGVRDAVTVLAGVSGFGSLWALYDLLAINKAEVLEPAVGVMLGGVALVAVPLALRSWPTLVVTPRSGTVRDDPLDTLRRYHWSPWVGRDHHLGELVVDRTAFISQVTGVVWFIGILCSLVFGPTQSELQFLLLGGTVPGVSAALAVWVVDQAKGLQLGEVVCRRDLRLGLVGIIGAAAWATVALGGTMYAVGPLVIVGAAASLVSVAQVADTELAVRRDEVRKYFLELGDEAAA